MTPLSTQHICLSQTKTFAIFSLPAFVLILAGFFAPAFGAKPFSNITSMSVNMEGKEMFKLFARQDYKIWGLDYCANYSRDLQANAEVKKDIDSLKERLKWGGKRPLKELQNYIDKHHKIRSLLSCFAMYDSQKYQDEVERIIRKYCKDCYCETCK
ncbi:hypothetical protein [Helicobacter sp. T3_23-1059]